MFNVCCRHKEFLCVCLSREKDIYLEGVTWDMESKVNVQAITVTFVNAFHCH